MALRTPIARAEEKAERREGLNSVSPQLPAREWGSLSRDMTTDAPVWGRRKFRCVCVAPRPIIVTPR